LPRDLLPFSMQICIVTPNYNGARFLPDTLDSIIAQHGDIDVQCIVQDGGSTDESHSILESYEKRLKRGELRARAKSFRFQYFIERDEGQYDAVNRGFARTDADILAYLNSDDVYLPGALQAVCAAFRDNPDVRWLTSCWPVRINDQGVLVSTDRREGFSHRWFMHGQHLPGGGGFARWFVQQDCTFWRRSLSAEVGPFNTAYDLAADFDMWLRMFQKTELYAVRALLAAFRIHPTQKTADQSAYVNEAFHILREAGGRPTRGVSGLLHGIVHPRLQRSGLLRKLLAAFRLGHDAPFLQYDERSGAWRSERRRQF